MVLRHRRRRRFCVCVWHFLVVQRFKLTRGPLIRFYYRIYFVATSCVADDLQSAIFCIYTIYTVPRRPTTTWPIVISYGILNF